MQALSENAVKSNFPVKVLKMFFFFEDDYKKCYNKYIKCLFDKTKRVELLELHFNFSKFNEFSINLGLILFPNRHFLETC